MNHSLLDSSWWGTSNGGTFMFLGLVDDVLYSFYVLETFWNISLSIDHRNIKIPPLDAPGYDEFENLYFIFLRSLDVE